MAIFGRKTLKSARARMRRVDQVFAWIAKIYLLLYFIFVIIAWLSYRESFRIDSVIVLGTHVVDRAQVQFTAEQFLSQKILWKIDRNNKVFYPKGDLSVALYGLDSHIKEVSMAVVPAKTLSIKITEYSPAYLWCAPGGEGVASGAGNCFLADALGLIYAKAPNYSGYPFPVFYTNIAGNEEQGSPIGLAILPASELQKVFFMIAELEKNNITVSQIKQTDEYDYSLTTNQPWLIQWSSTKDPMKSVENLKLVLAGIARSGKSSTTPVSIDLRFGNKIFYK